MLIALTPPCFASLLSLLSQKGTAVGREAVYFSRMDHRKVEPSTEQAVSPALDA